MATIFNTLADRQTFAFTQRIAAIYTGICPDVTAISASSFKFQANSGPEITITVTGSYAFFSDFRTAIETQISGTYGSSVSVTQQDQEMLIFFDVNNEFIKISDVSSALHVQTGLLNVERSVGLEVEELTVMPVEKILSVAGSVFGVKHDGLSNLISIPRGANSLSFYYSTFVGVDGYGDPVYDGSDPEIYMYVGWTNGIDGYVIDGYFDEMCINSDNKYQSSTGIFPTKIAQFGGVKYAMGHNAIGTKAATPAIEIPVGATGCYIALTLANNDTSRYPPSITIAAISGTR